METGSLNSRTARGLRALGHRGPLGAGQENWPVLLGAGLAVAVGAIAGGGSWQLALAAALVPVFAVVAIAAPERTALGLIVVLPFLFYPASIGGFSLFLGVPAFGFVSIVLLTRTRPPLGVLRRDLPVVSFALLMAAALVAALLSDDQLTAFSRVAYLLLFGLVAFSVAGSIAAGRLTRSAVAKALLGAGALAGTAIVLQFLAQFASGQGPVLDWLFDVRSFFAGERSAVADKSNWVVDNLNVVRGVFPFMTPASAGQFLMFALIAGVWLRREDRAGSRAASKVVLVLLLIVAAALLFTLSRQSWIGAAAGIVALGLSRRPQWIVAAVVALIAVALVPIPGVGNSFGDYLLSASDTSTESTDTRLELWEASVELIPEHALIGSGPGTIGSFGQGDRPFYAHNVFLDSAVEVGLIGALALLAVFLGGMRKALRNGAILAFALLAAAVVAGLFDDTLYFPRNGLLLALAFALVAATRAHGQDPEAAQAER
jgi:O-antigen ligase